MGKILEIARSAQAANDSTCDFPSKETVPDLIMSLARMITAHFLGNIENRGVTSAQAHVLAELMLKGPQSQVDLARNLEVGKASIGETLARLDRDGLICRDRSTADRRAMVISLTDKAIAMREDLVVNAWKQVTLTTQIMGEKQADQLRELLSSLSLGLRAVAQNDDCTLN